METVIGKTRSGTVVKIPHGKILRQEAVAAFIRLSEADFIDIYAMCQALQVRVANRKLREPYARNLRIYIEAMDDVRLLLKKDEKETLYTLPLLAQGRTLLSDEFREG